MKSIKHKSQVAIARIIIKLVEKTLNALSNGQVFIGNITLPSNSACHLQIRIKI
jgi:hypothetical protein